MTAVSAVLLLVNDDAYRRDVARQLEKMQVLPITIRADVAATAVEQFMPIAVVLDAGYASSAPDDFLESACAHHVRLVTLPDRRHDPMMSDDILRDAVTSHLLR